jgi:hypothetical protein
LGAPRRMLVLPAFKPDISRASTPTKRSVASVTVGTEISNCQPQPLNSPRNLVVDGTKKSK